MPLGDELSEHLVGPIGVLGSTWVLPPWCEKQQHRLHANAKDILFACNDGPSTFIPLCYTGSFGMVQFFWPKLDNALGLPAGTVVAVKYQDTPLKDLKGVDKEIELLKECAGKQVVPLYHVSRQASESWMVMPFVGYNLRGTLVQPLSDMDAASIFLQLLRGLKDMHCKGVLHRDLKPENILIARDAMGPSLFIADLGHACGGKSAWPRDDFATTLEYSAPEIWEQGLVPAGRRDAVRQKERCPLTGTYGEATDIWAVTIILLQIVLRTVFIPGVLEGTVIEPFVMYLGVLNLTDKIEEIIQAAGDLPDPVKAMLRTGLQKDPLQRLGPEGTGIQHMLALAEDWYATCKLHPNHASDTSTTKVTELLKSATNAIIVEQNLSSRIPPSFEAPPQIAARKFSFESEFAIRATTPLAQQTHIAPLSPGSMV